MPPLAGDAPRGGGGGGSGVAPIAGGAPGSEAALDDALQMEGLHERRDRDAIKQFLRTGGVGMDPATTAWCAGFVNASLARHGISGTRSGVATDFMNWGEAAKDGVRKGDVLVQPRGRGPGQTGGHVGMATGRTRVFNGRRQVEMLSGNKGDRVQRTWEDAASIVARRATEAQERQAKERAQQRDASTSGGLRPQADAVQGAGSMYDPTAPGAGAIEGGPRTASGELYDPNAYSAAIQTQLRGKFGGVGYGRNYVEQWADVTDPATGKTVRLKINDVGPLAPGRVIDLNRRAMSEFDPTMKRGVIPNLTVTPLEPGRRYTGGPVERQQQDTQPDTWGRGARPAPFMSDDGGALGSFSRHGDREDTPTPRSGGEDFDDARRARQELERPIRANLDLGGSTQFGRASMRREADREVREARFNSTMDIGAA